MAENQGLMTINALSNVKHSGRVEILDLKTFDQFDLRLSDAAATQIRRLEESVLTADERLGIFRVG